MENMTRKDLTSGDIRKYIKAGGICCPYCKASGIETQDGGHCDGVTYLVSVVCKGCKRTWYEVYKLCDVEEEPGDMYTGDDERGV
jgi:hypothetical protein